MKVIGCLALGMMGVFFAGCRVEEYMEERGSGRMVTEQRAVSGIRGISLATAGRLVIETGDSESLRIEAEDNMIPHIQTEVFNGVLTIRTPQRWNLHLTRDIQYHVTVKSLESIAILSSGDIQAPDLRAGEFAINVSSSGDLRMGALQTDKLTVNISSSGNVDVGTLHAGALEAKGSSSGDLSIGGGEAARQTITLSSSGDYQAPNLDSDEAQVSLNSSGNASLRVRHQLTANLNSSGDLRYQGNPTLNVRKNSSGDVFRIGQ